MMSLFLIAALGLARDQTFLKLGEVTSLKESAAHKVPGPVAATEVTEDVVEKMRKKAEQDVLDLQQVYLKKDKATFYSKFLKGTKTMKEVNVFGNTFHIPGLKLNDNSDAQKHKEKITGLTQSIHDAQDLLLAAIQNQSCSEAAKGEIELLSKKLQNEIKNLNDKVDSSTAEANELREQLDAEKAKKEGLPEGLGFREGPSNERFGFQENQELGEAEDVDLRPHVSANAKLYEDIEKLGKALEAAQAARAEERGHCEEMMNLQENHWQEMLGRKEEERKKTDAEHRSVLAKLEKEYQESFDRFNKKEDENEIAVQELNKKLQGALSSGDKDGDLVTHMKEREESLVKQAAEHKQEKIALANRIRELEALTEEVSIYRNHFIEALKKNSELSTENSTLKNYVSSIASTQDKNLSFGVKGENLTDNLQEVLDTAQHKADMFKKTTEESSYMAEELDQLRSQRNSPAADEGYVSLNGSGRNSPYDGN